MTMKTSSKKWQKIRKIKGLRQFVTWYPRHVSENPGFKALGREYMPGDEVHISEYLAGCDDFKIYMNSRTEEAEEENCV